jgi:hypothetical protein
MTEGTRNDDHGVRTEDSPLLVNETNPHIYGDDNSLSEPAQRSRPWYIWRLLWFSVVVFVLFIFIKGWIGADQDFKVSGARLQDDE